MRDRDLYARILGIERPWRVTGVELALKEEEVRVQVECQARGRLPCPKCGRPCGGYDTRRRRWRHLDTCQLKTILEAEVPRVKCPDHGVRQIRVPWAEPLSGFTALFECVVIDWLKEGSITAVAVQLRLTWDEVDGIMERAVRRGLARREELCPKRIGVDETSYQKRQEYVTCVTDLEKGVVLYVADDHKTESLDGFYEQIGPKASAGVEVVAMDMWQPYVNSTRKHVPDADEKIAFDKFHVASLLGDAVDTVRKQEHRALMQQGDERLLKTKYLWLRNPENMSEEAWRGRFAELRASRLRTARAWAIKEEAMGLWDYVSRVWAEKAWKNWLGWAMRSRLEPVKKTARTIRDHLWGILNAILFRATSAVPEALNAGIQRVKRMACGFRNRERFRRAIYFHFGGLDLYPALPLATHTGS
jgi:transposase